VCQRLEACPLALEQVDDILLGGIDDAPRLLVDELLGYWGGRVGAREQHSVPAAIGYGHRADGVTHAPAADHAPRDLSQVLDVGLRAGGDLAVDDLLGGAAA
jgi:hypothetical protein